MKMQALRQLTTMSCFVILATLMLASPAMTQNGQADEIQANGDNGNSNKKPKISIQPLVTFSGQAIIPGGGSILTRTAEGVYMSLHSTDLTPGTVVSAWFVFFNSPKKCNTSPCTPADFSNADSEPSLVAATTGRIIGEDGKADFGAFRAVGDTTGAVFGPGLTNPMKAEIHLVTRSHGPAILEDPELLRQQLTAFNGGCPPNTCPNLQASIHKP